MAAKKKAAASTRSRVVHRGSPTVSRAELSELFGINRTTVDEWRRAGLPETRKGSTPQFVVSEVFRWRLAREKAAAARDDETIDLERVRARRERAQAELAELALAEARGEVVPLDLVLELVGEEYDRIRPRILAITRQAARLARAKTTPKAKVILAEVARGILDELTSGESVAERAREAGKESRRVKAPTR